MDGNLTVARSRSSRAKVKTILPAETRNAASEELMRTKFWAIELKGQ